MKEEEKILNTIALKVGNIKELKEIKEKVDNNVGDKVKFKIQTVGLYYFADFIKEKSTLDVSKHTMQLILDGAIEKEQEKIDKLIDLLLEERKHEDNAQSTDGRKDRGRNKKGKRKAN